MYPILSERSRDSWRGFRIGIAVGIGLAILAAIFLLLRCTTRQPDMQERILLYFEELQPAGKLVLLSARQRYSLSREFSARLLALIDVQARIDLGVIADLSYYIELTDPSALHIEWDRPSRHLSVLLPPLQLLPPAIRTETITTQTEGANLVSEFMFKLKRAAESMKAGLSEEVARQAVLSLQVPQVQREAAAAMERLISTWLRQRYGLEDTRILVEFRPQR